MKNAGMMPSILLLFLFPIVVYGFAKESKDVDIHYLHRMRGPDRERFEALGDRDPAGLITSLRGLSYILRAQASLQTALKAPVFVPDTLKTERGASLKVYFIDQTTLAMAGETEVVLQDYLYGDPAHASLFVEKGVVHFMAGEISKISIRNFHIETGNATIGIRGSGGVVRVVPDLDAGDPWVDIGTAAGHELEVWTKSGAHATIKDPRLGIRVSPGGQIFPLGFPGGALTLPLLREKVMVLPSMGRTRPTRRPVQPMGKNTIQQFVILRGRGRRRSLDQRTNGLAVDQLSSLESVSETFTWEGRAIMKKEDLSMRDEEFGRERPSAMPLMQRLAQEERAKHAGPAPKTSLTQDQCNNESASSLPILKKLGEEIQAKESQKSKVEKESL
ncbi:MAG: FecR domain-containing protein [Chlamydiia bacterium]|nr:FecR domain-containing protein [Chlamydiia bacterium]